MKAKMTSDDIIANAVRQYWKEAYAQDVIVFFYQKYDFEKEWEWCSELVFPEEATNYEAEYILTNIFNCDIITLKNNSIKGVFVDEI